MNLANWRSKMMVDKIADKFEAPTPLATSPTRCNIERRQKVGPNTFQTFYPITKEVSDAIEKIVSEKFESIMLPPVEDSTFYME